GLDAPNAIEDLVAAHGLAAAVVEEADELDLVVAALALFAVGRERLGDGVDHGPADLDALQPRLAASRVGAPEQRSHAREHLTDGEGLGDVVVGAGVEPADLVALLAARGEHHDAR